MKVELAIISLTTLAEHPCREPKHFNEVNQSIAKLIAAIEKTDLSAKYTGAEQYLVDNMDWSQDQAERDAATDTLQEIVYQLSQPQRAILFTALDLELDDASQHPITQAFSELTGDIVRCAAPWYRQGHNLSIYDIK